MADYRTVQTRMWREDGWFQNLPTDARLLWIYLFTNPSASICGMYRLPIRTITFESGIPEKRVRELLAQFGQEGKAYYEGETVWVVRMRENQLGDKISENQRRGIERDLAKVPACAIKNRYLRHYGYPTDTLSANEDTLCIGVLNDTDTVTDTVTDTGTKHDAARKAPHPPLSPQVQVYLANNGVLPKGKLRDGTNKEDKAAEYITARVRPDPASLALWGRVVAGYTAQWSAHSYTTMVTEFYEKGRIPGEANKPGSNGHAGKVPPAQAAVSIFLQEAGIGEEPLIPGLR